jgi:hypothetical protein
MPKIEMLETSNLNNENNFEEDEIGESYGNRGYIKIPIDQINLNTEPISITNNHSFLRNNIRTYAKVFLGFLAVLILLIIVSILASHFHHEIELNKLKISNNLDGPIFKDSNQVIRNQEK